MTPSAATAAPAAGQDATASMSVDGVAAQPQQQQQGNASLGGSSESSSSSALLVVDGVASAPQLLRSFQAAQEERCQLYSRLHAGFRAYLSGRDEVAYRHLMANVTQGFAECSKKVLAIESTLKAPPLERPDLAALLRRVQEGEKEKLQVTVSMHALRTAMALRSERQQMEQQQREAAAAAAAASGAASSSLAPGDALHTHHVGCGCARGVDEDEYEVEEASEEECAGAVREMMVRLDRVVGGINEALEEVVQELEDEE